MDLVSMCKTLFDNLEILLQQNKKNIKGENDKGKVCDQNQKTSSCNGQEKLSSSYSGAISYSYKALMVPKEMLKKTKRIVETTTNLNKSFIKFLQQKSENTVINSSTKLRQLKAFKSVLGDLKKAHKALEECLAFELASAQRKSSSKKRKDVTSEPKLSKERKTNEQDGERRRSSTNARDGEKVTNCESGKHKASEESPKKDHNGKPIEVLDDVEVSSKNDATMEVENVELVENLVEADNETPKKEEKEQEEQEQGEQEQINSDINSDLEDKSPKSQQSRKKNATEKSRHASGEKKEEKLWKEQERGSLWC